LVREGTACSSRLDGVESDAAHTFGDPGGWYSTPVGDSYTIAAPIPLSMDLSRYRDDPGSQSEGPFDLLGPGLGAVYTVLVSALDHATALAEVGLSLLAAN
jgi:hypothetical protein